MDFMEQHMKKMSDGVREARKKYDPLVQRLTDIEFIAIFQAVEEERARRIQNLIITNPLVRKMAVDNLVEQFKEEEEAMRDERN